jgi:2-polyprenyl-3-methyl-5-hydroxy-6-metoxy-1,4-benzoquinol methylase
LNDNKKLQDARQYWDNAAASFDDEPDHSLHDSSVLEAWTNFLRASLPDDNATVLDIGCGTGSLSVVLARLGHKVTGVDFSPSMISLARMKAEALNCHIEFHTMDAASPVLPKEHFDTIVCRHLLWALPEPKRVLLRWAELLKGRGRLILVEGYWATGAGLHAQQIMDALPSSFTDVSLQSLSGNSEFWGREVSDERYAIIAAKNQ